MKIKDFVRLECTTGGSNKFYELWLESSGGGYNVCFKYGPIGQPGVGGVKRADVTYSMATASLNDIKSEKMAKGYKVKGTSTNMDDDGGSYVTKNPILLVKEKDWPDNQDMKNPVGIMQPTDWPLKNVGALLEGSEWGMQQKMNGKFIRVVASQGGQAVSFYNKIGKAVSMSTYAGTFREVAKNVAIDCEALNDKLYAFDMPSCADSFENRYLALKKYVMDALDQSDRLQIVPMYAGSDKMQMFSDLQQSKQEGVVFKKLKHGYDPGKTENQGAACSLKVKFWKEASVLSNGFTDKSSIKLFVFEGGKMVSVGKVTVPEKYKPQLKKFDCVVRVRYLYATKAHQLYQTTLDPDDNGNVVRDDIETTDYASLSIKQLQYEGVADEDEPKRSIIV